MIILRPLRDADVPGIRAWPAYPPEFADLDYCLRTGGWLDEYRKKSGATILAAVDGGEIAGFSILSDDGPGIREFRIALHPARIGTGAGRTILRRTLEYGFADMRVKAVQLIVRRNNLRAQQLYLQEHFTATGECVKDVLGKPVEFFTMAIDRRTFFLGNRS